MNLRTVNSAWPHTDGAASMSRAGEADARDLVSTQLAVLLASVDYEGGLSDSTVESILKLYDHQVR